MRGYKLLEEVFGEDLDDIFSLIRDGDLEGVTTVTESLSYNSGWYNYYVIMFDYKGKRYSFEYKDHTSDNVCDMSYLPETFYSLGDVEELSQTITREELAQIQNQHEKSLETLKPYKDVLNIIKPLSVTELEFVAKIFHDVKEKDPKASETKIGNFFEELAKMKKNKKW